MGSDPLDFLRTADESWEALFDAHTGEEFDEVDGFVLEADGVEGGAGATGEDGDA